MLAVLSILFLIFYDGNCGGLKFIQYPDPQPELETCVGDVMKKYFNDAQKLTYFNPDFENDKLLLYIHSLQIMGVTIRRTTETVGQTNSPYLIVARNESEFTESVAVISNWNLYARFLIVIDSLHDIELEKVFNTLLQLHIYNVVVVNGTNTADLYSYNPFEDYACGKYYSRIITFGKCSSAESADLYPNKLVTGLRNCTFTVSCPHWPPYSIDPTKSDDKPYIMGTEQYVFDIMSHVEQFKYKFVYDYDPEMFSNVSQNMSVSGPMWRLRTNHTDLMLGGNVLTLSRARVFSYVHGYLDQVEEIRIMVKRASTTPSWKSIYLEFTPLVWTLLLLVLVIYAILLMMLLKAQDRGHVVLMLLDQLFLHGNKFQARLSVNIIFFFWVWFAYLINCFYQSSLTSLTTMPSTEYQINDEQDLYTHSTRACISTVMQSFMVSEESNLAIAFTNSTEDESCKGILSSIKAVSQKENMFTIIPYTIYLYSRQRYYDKYGRSPVYSFPKPYTKLIYAMYFFKGFPMSERLYEIALRIRETGLSDRSLQNQYFLRATKYKFHTRELETRFVSPWYVYIFGISVSSLTFLVEIATSHTN